MKIRAWKEFLFLAVVVIAAIVGSTYSLAWLSAKDTGLVAVGLGTLIAEISMILAAGRVFLIRWRLVSEDPTPMPKQNRRGLPNEYVVLALCLLTATGCTRIEPGKVGIIVNMWGTEKGVASYVATTGVQTYNPITSSVFEYPTYVQTAIWTRDEDDKGSPGNEEVSFNSKEGMVITADVSLSYQLESEKVPTFYVKFRSDNLDTFTHGFLRNVARDAFNELAPTYTVEEVYGPKKEEFLAKVRARINDQVKDFGVSLQQFGFMGAPRLPDNVVAALNGKIKATQDAIRVENELRQAEAEAKKRVAAAKGEAEARLAAAEGEAKANELLTKSLSPTLLEWKRLEITERSVAKWNGEMPRITGGALPFIQVESEMYNKK